MAEVKFRDNSETHEITTALTDSPRAMLPAGKPVAEEAPDDPLGETLTISDVARLLGCSVWTVRQRCLPQGLPYFRVAHSGKLIFYRSQVTRWILEKQKTERR